MLLRYPWHSVFCLGFQDSSFNLQFGVEFMNLLRVVVGRSRGRQLWLICWANRISLSSLRLVLSSPPFLSGFYSVFFNHGDSVFLITLDGIMLIAKSTKSFYFFDNNEVCFVKLKPPKTFKFDSSNIIHIKIFSICPLNKKSSNNYQFSFDTILPFFYINNQLLNTLLNFFCNGLKELTGKIIYWETIQR